MHIFFFLIPDVISPVELKLEGNIKADISAASSKRLLLKLLTCAHLANEFMVINPRVTLRLTVVYIGPYSPSLWLWLDDVIICQPSWMTT